MMSYRAVVGGSVGVSVHVVVMGFNLRERTRGVGAEPSDKAGGGTGHSVQVAIICP